MATNKVEPRPKSTAFTGGYERKVWDEKYKATHNADGTPKPAPTTSTGRSSADARRTDLGRSSADSRRTDNGPAAASRSMAPAPKKKSGFGDAFKAARAAGLSTFEFGGKKFNTMQAGETKEQHTAALAKIKEKNQEKLDKLMMEKTGPRKTAPKLDEMAKGGMVKKAKKKK